MVQWFCAISWWLFDVWTTYFRIKGQYGQTFDLKINVGHCNLYFMVQWFCLISWRLFDVCTSYFGIMNQYGPRFDLKINISHCDLYFMVQWLPCIWKTIWCMNIIIWDYDSVWPDLKINVGHFDIWSSDFVLYLKDCLMYDHHLLGLWVGMTSSLTSK